MHFWNACFTYVYVYWELEELKIVLRVWIFGAELVRVGLQETNILLGLTMPKICAGFTVLRKENM